MIKNIVFDMGNVLVRFDPELFMDRYSLTGEDRKLIRNEVFRSVEWTMLDRGVIDEEIAEQHILPRLPERLHVEGRRGMSPCTGQFRAHEVQRPDGVAWSSLRRFEESGRHAAL